MCACVYHMYCLCVFMPLVVLALVILAVPMVTPHCMNVPMVTIMIVYIIIMIITSMHSSLSVTCIIYVWFPY